MKKRTLLTSALPYANGFIHLGHCAGAYLPADIYARYRRLTGDELLWVCGSDEHGVAITIAAEKEKVTPKDIIDKYHNANKQAFDDFGMSFDIYSRTSHEAHHETAKEFFKDFLDKGYLIEKEEEQFFDPQANIFLPDRYVEGECPNCGAEGARGDQCDSCGAYYNQTEMKNPISKVSGKTPIVKKTNHWYMRFDQFQEFLENYIEENAGRWKANVIQQTRSWLKEGFSERAITRDLTWGVSIDDIEGIEKEKAEGKCLYVWFEAVLGYISATKELIRNMSELDSNINSDDWKKWWQDEATRYVAFIGKDNIVFHTLIFPALLQAKGRYILPDNVPANEFLNLEGQKISKSRNWSIDLKDFVEDFKDVKYIDALRYALAMSFPETRDADFTWKDFQARNNNELASILGNFINRCLQFTHKNFDGKVPTLSDKYANYNADWKKLYDTFAENAEAEINNADYSSMNDNDILLVKSIAAVVKAVESNYERYRFRDAITETMNIARAANKYFNDEEPWKTNKSDPESAAKTLYACVQLVRMLALYFAPIVPFSMEKVFKTLNVDAKLGVQNFGNSTQNYWADAAYPAIEQGQNIEKPEILFTRIEDETIEEQMAKLGDQEDPEFSEDDMITFDEVMKVAIRTGKVIEAEKVKKSKKLLKLQVDLGREKRQIVAGIAEHYKAEEMIGKMVCVVANLKPAKLMGVESQGMILAASNAEGKLCIVTPEDAGLIGAGAEVR